MKMLADLKSDMISGAIVVTPGPWPEVHRTAERLSGHYTDANGHRSMDILHVATAIELGVIGSGILAFGLVRYYYHA